MTQYITKFNFDNYGSWYCKTKRDVFDHTISQLMYKMKENNINEDIEFSEIRLKDLTKNTKSFIKQLLTDKKIVQVSTDKYKINTKQVFCRYCYKEEYIKSKTEYNRQFSKYNGHIMIYEWQINDHLINQHYMNQKPYDWSEDRSIRNPINQQVINEYITEIEPKFDICEHNFKVTNIDNSRLDRVKINIKCDNCNYDHDIYSEVQTCIKEIIEK